MMTWLILPVLVIGGFALLLARAFTKSNMSKYQLINFLIGSTIAIVLSMLILLGLRIFIPAPVYPSYDYNSSQNCRTGDDACYQAQNKVRSDAQQQYKADNLTYSGRIFVAANIVGILVLILGLLAFVARLGTNIATGVIISGAFGIIYAYILGWAGADDKLKFIVGVIVALILIAGGVAINRHRDRVSPTATA